MQWIGKPSAQRIAQPSDAPVESPKSLEYPSRISAKGVAPGQAVIEQLSALECRFRTVLFFVPNDVVELEFGGGSGASVRGRIVSRVSIGPRFAYRRDAMSRSLDRLKTSVRARVPAEVAPIRVARLKKCTSEQRSLALKRRYAASMRSALSFTPSNSPNAANETREGSRVR